jgi:hypothetical protein
MPDKMPDNDVRKLPQIRDNDVIIDLATWPAANDIIISLVTSPAVIIIGLAL